MVNRVLKFRLNGKIVHINSEEIMVDGKLFKCQKCGWTWLPKVRDFYKAPQHCPECKDKYWCIIKKTNVVEVLEEKVKPEISEEKIELQEKETEFQENTQPEQIDTSEELNNEIENINPTPIDNSEENKVERRFTI